MQPSAIRDLTDSQAADLLRGMRGAKAYSSNSNLSWKIYSIISQGRGSPSRLSKSSGTEQEGMETKTKVMIGVLAALGVYYFFYM